MVQRATVRPVDIKDPLDGARRCAPKLIYGAFAIVSFMLLS